MTLSDFRANILMVLHRKMQEKRMASVMLTAVLAGLISEEARKQTSELNAEVTLTLEDMEKEINALHGSASSAKLTSTRAPSTRKLPPAAPAVQDDPDRRRMVNLVKIDTLMAKMTGRPTNAQWAATTGANIFDKETDSDQIIDGYVSQMQVQEHEV